MSPPSGPPKDRTVSGQGLPAQGLPAAHGSLQAEEWGRKLNPAHPNQPSPWELQAKEGPRVGTISMDGGLPGRAVPGSEVGGSQKEELQRECALRSGASSCPHKPGHYGCRRQASGRGPGGSFGVHPSAGLPWRVPPPGPHDVALCLHPEGKEKLRGSRTIKCPGQWRSSQCVSLPGDRRLTL